MEIEISFELGQIWKRKPDSKNMIEQSMKIVRFTILKKTR